ncbi:MAG: hypothetical protein ACJKSS_00205 [Patescibacteria group bacterium UBA2103]
MNFSLSDLSGKQILFIVPLSSGISEEEYVEMGSVISIDPDHEKAFVSFLYHGYKSAADPIPFSHILAVYDENGERLKIANFSGPSIDLRDKAPFGTHKMEARACA